MLSQVRNAGLVLVGVFVYGEEVSRAQSLGYALSLAAFAAYTAMRHRHGGPPRSRRKAGEGKDRPLEKTAVGAASLGGGGSSGGGGGSGGSGSGSGCGGKSVAVGGGGGCGDSAGGGLASGLSTAHFTTGAASPGHGGAS